MQILAAELGPDVLLIAAQIEETGASDVVRAIAGNYPHVRVIVLPDTSEDRDILEAARACARGHIEKTVPVEGVIEQIKKVVAGGVAFDEEIMLKLVAAVAADRTPIPSGTRTSVLTRREREVLDLVAQQRSNRNISALLGIRQEMVRAHVRRLLQKLQLDNRSQLISYAERERQS